jgi:hypothetical protein
MGKAFPKEISEPLEELSKITSEFIVKKIEADHNFFNTTMTSL